MNAITVLQEHQMPQWKCRLLYKLPMIFVVLISCGAADPSSPAHVTEGITFAVVPGKIYLPVEEVGSLLRCKSGLDQTSGRVLFNDRSVLPTAVRRLIDGTVLVAINDLEGVGAALDAEADGRGMRVSCNGSEFIVVPGEKRVEISLAHQNLKAWQGQRLVLSSRICSGRRGSTPSGNFRAGPYKARMHYSSRYDNAPMPWSVQVRGHLFIHGFRSVPNYPASHGCIRLPLTEGNPAKFFYEWIDCGTPVRVMRE